MSEEQAKKSKPKANDGNEERVKEETHAQKVRRWKYSSIIAGIIVVADLGIFYLGIVKNADQHSAIPLSLSIVGIGIITFFGMLSLATYQSTRSKEEGKPEKDEGHMRTALAGTLVCVYIVVFVLGATQEISVVIGENSILQHFSEVIMVVIVFYFGSKAAKEIAQVYANRGRPENGTTPK